jgi:hypothetical protein
MGSAPGGDAVRFAAIPLRSPGKRKSPPSGGAGEDDGEEGDDREGHVCSHTGRGCMRYRAGATRMGRCGTAATRAGTRDEAAATAPRDSRARARVHG